jgi:DNA excision repair protein ERCC-4
MMARLLCSSTIYSDAVSLYALVKRYRAQDYAMSSSGWVLLDSAEQIFNVSKRRVYNDRDEFCPEPCPKWKALSEVLRVEIPSDIKEENKGRRDSNIVKEAVKVLILCSDARTCYQLNQYLTQGSEKYLFITALKNQVHVTKLAESYKNFSTTELKETPVLVQKVATYFDKAKTSAKAVEPKQPAAAASGPLSKKIFKNFGKPKAPAPPIDEDGEKKDDEPKYEEPKEIELFTKEEVEESDNWCFRDSYVLTMSQKPGNDEPTTGEAADDSFDITQMEKGDFENVVTDESTQMNVTAGIDPGSVKPVVIIQTFKSQQNGFVSLDKTLAELNPKYIVMYHVNVAAIRQIEMHEARLRRDPKHRVKVFFLTHSKTIEEQSYLTSLRREKQAFELLIETKRVRERWAGCGLLQKGLISFLPENGYPKVPRRANGGGFHTEQNHGRIGA